RTAEGANPMRRWQPRGTIVAAVLLTGGALWAETRFDSPWCGNVAALAADFALVLAFMRLAGRAAALFLRPARQALGFAGRLAVDRLVRIPDQLALAAAVLALGLGLMMTAAAGDAPAALAAVRAGTGVLVSRNFARQFDVGVGATLRLDTPAGPFEAPVAGVIVDYVSPRGSVILARPTYLRWWQDRSANRFH